MTTARDESASRLPWPPEWPSRIRLRPLALMFFLALMAVSLIPLAVSSFVSGDYGSGMFALMGSIFLQAVATLGFLIHLPGRRRGLESIHSSYVDEIEQQAVAIPYWRMLDAAIRALFMAFFLFWSFLALVTGLVISDSGLGDTAAILWFAFSSVILLMVLGVFVHMARGKIVRGKLALSPTGVYHRSWTFRSFHSWEDIVFISARNVGMPLIGGAVLDTTKVYYRRTSRLWKQPDFVLAPHVGVKGNYLSVNPALAYYALRFYHEHPEARSELGTDAGVERLRRADVLG